MVDVAGGADDYAFTVVGHAFGIGCSSNGNTGETSIQKRRFVSYLAAVISSTMACVAARGSDAAVIGRPTTRKSAPARMASAGVAVRD